MSASTTATSRLIRFNKLLAHKGYGSRREVDNYIEKGYFQVNGKVITKLGIQIQESSRIELSSLGQQVLRSTNVSSSTSKSTETKTKQNTTTTVVLHKPLGIVSCQPDITKNQIPAIKLLTDANYYASDPNLSKYQRNRHNNEGQNQSRPNNKKQYIIEPYTLKKLAVAGRLDSNTTGLSVFTQCGITARTIIGPTSTMEKEYLVRINTTTTDSAITKPKAKTGDELRVYRSSLKPLATNSSLSSKVILNESDLFVQEVLERLRNGIYDDGELLKVQSVTIQNDDQLNFVLTDGKYHHLRRMCAAVGLTPTAIKRVRIGPIRLGALPLEQWRYLYPLEQNYFDSLKKI